MKVVNKILANGRVQETLRFLNYLMVGVFLFFWVDFLWSPWGSPNPWNPISDFLFERTGGQILYANHVVSALAVMLVTTYFILKNPFSKAGKTIFVIFSTVSVHELLLNGILNAFGFSFLPAYRETASFFYVLDLRWFFWLSLFLVFGLLFATKEQRTKLYRVTIVCAVYMFGWLTYLAVSHHSPWTLYHFSPAPMFLDPIDNSLEVFSWLLPLLVWFIPIDFKIQEMHPHNLLRYYMTYRNISVPIEMTPAAHMAFIKEQTEWSMYYLPWNGLKGKVVMDIGAGCGESAYFFFAHGASEVICVEPDPVKVAMLRRNAERRGWNVEIIPDIFRLEQLNRFFDFLKIDCDGGEDIMTKGQKLLIGTPTVIEVDSWFAARRFHKRFPEAAIVKRFHFPFNTWMVVFE